MKYNTKSAVILVALTALFRLAQAQMGTPAPSGPPSAQPELKSQTQQPALAESGAAIGGPQITLPLRRAVKDVPPVPDSGESAKPTKAGALEKCKAESSRKARTACRQQVAHDFNPASIP